MTSHAIFDSHTHGNNWFNQPERSQALSTDTTGINFSSGIHLEQIPELTSYEDGRNESLTLLQKSINSMADFTSNPFSSLFIPSEHVVNESELFILQLQLQQQQESQHNQQENLQYLSQGKESSTGVSDPELVSSGASSPSEDFSELFYGVTSPVKTSLLNSTGSLPLSIENQVIADMSAYKGFESALSSRHVIDNPFNPSIRTSTFLEEFFAKTAGSNNIAFPEFIFPLKTPSSFQTSNSPSFRSPTPARIIGDSSLYKADFASTTPSRVVNKFDGAITLEDGLSAQIDGFACFSEKSDILSPKNLPVQLRTSPSHVEKRSIMTEKWVRRNGIITPNENSNLGNFNDTSSTPNHSPTRLAQLNRDNTQRTMSILPNSAFGTFEEGQLTPVSIASTKTPKSFMERLAAVSDSPSFDSTKNALKMNIRKARINKAVPQSPVKKAVAKRLSERLAKALQSPTPPSPTSGTFSSLSSPSSSLASPAPSEAYDDMSTRRPHGRKPTKIEPLKMQIDEVLVDPVFNEHFSMENEASEGKTYVIRDFDLWQCAWCWCPKADTPAIRKGPFGQKSLCNACGMFFVRNKCLPRDRRDRRHVISASSKSPSSIPRGKRG